MNTDDLFFPPTLRTPQPLPRRPDRTRFVVRVDLDHAEPSIWRRLRFASDLTLAQLHEILQLAMGWTDSHLHHFVMGPEVLDHGVQPFLTPFDVEEEGEEGILEGDVRLDQTLSEIGDKLFYEYDFGDGWQHTVQLEHVEPWMDGEPVALCLAGERACPPEDVGGLGGLGELLEVLAGDTAGKDPEWVDQLLSWLPDGYDPVHFSTDEVNEQLSLGPLPPLENWHPYLADLLYRAGGSGLSELGTLIKRATSPAHWLTAEETAAAVGPYTVLLRTVGDGIALTAAGHLPPRIVASLYTELHMEEEWIGKGNREDLTLPVLQLRESATALGLLRKARGRLTLTAAGRKVAEDSDALWRHIASRLPLGRPHERDAGFLGLLLTAAGSDIASADDAEAIMDRLGWGVRDGDLGRAAYYWSRPTAEVVRNLAGNQRDLATSSRIARALIRYPDGRS